MKPPSCCTSLFLRNREFGLALIREIDCLKLLRLSNLSAWDSASLDLFS